MTTRPDQKATAKPPLPQPALPKGGGALAPIGEKFVTNPQTGTASLSIPIPTTPGRNGFGPQLALDYDSGTGNGPFGLGWSVAIPSITRKTDRGLPRYPQFGDPDDDEFVFAGAEDLVPVSVPTLDANGEHVIAYRPRVDALFARIERRRRGDGTEYWVVITKDNVRSVFGASTQARLADPADDRRVFRWFLEWSDDDRGDVVAYYYKPEDRLDREVSNLYLKAIGYLNAMPRSFADRVTSPLATPIEGWPLVVLFDYGEHDLAAIAAGNADVLTEATWPMRPDSHSSFRSTFEIRTRRTCRHVLMLHRITEDGDYDRRPGASHSVTRVVRLDHKSDERITYLEGITHEGWRRLANGTYEIGAFPTIRLGYSTAEHPSTAIETLDAASADGVLAAFDGSHAQLVDFDGEGLPGVLSAQGAAWWYKRPNGPPLAPSDPAHHATRWSPPRRIGNRPNVSLEGGAVLQDWNGDGSVDVVQLGGAMRGVYARQPLPRGSELLDDDWQPFRPFAELPADLDFTNPNLRFADLDGDGFPDVIINDDDVIRLHLARAGREARGRDGYDEQQRVVKLGNEDDPQGGKFPIFANRSAAVVLADMTGDGLADIVHVTASACTYWPNLGYGRFGRRIVMERAPILAARPDFDPTRVRFADFDGTGTADLVYLDHDAVRVFPNLAGNAFGTEVRVPLPQPGHIEILDLWGRGMSTIMWTSSLARDRPRRVRYADLFAVKPHLLRTIDNGHGLSRTIEYTASTRHYLADRRAGRPWITRLPFPVQVIDRVITYDAVAETRTATTYAYHHGYYDGAEREFRGFGMVETRDSEDFNTFYGDSDASVTGVDRTLHRPTVVMKSWFHTGAFVGSDIVSKQFASEYDRSDLATASLPDSVVPSGLSPEELREAVRALRGRPLRQETYAEDGDPADPASIARAKRPYAVVESTFTVRLEHARGDGNHAVLSVHPRETLSYHYERNPDDPRVTHELVVEVSPSGAIVDKVAIAYPRRGVYIATVAKNLRAQGIVHATLAHAELRDAAASAEAHRRDVVIREDIFELAGLPAGRVLGFDEVAAFVTSATEIAYSPRRRTDDRLGFAAGKHLLQRTRHRYWDEAGQNLLPIGAVARRVLPARTESLAYTQSTLAPVLARDPGLNVAAILTSSRGGYIHDSDDSYWAPSATVAYDGVHFFVAVSAMNPFGGVQRVEYDPLFALTAAAFDAMDNPTRIARDYRLFQPSAITDPNGTVSSVDVDARGIAIATYLGQGTLGGQTAAIDYAFFDATAPSRVHARAFTDYNAATPTPEESWLYSDGNGREALRKVRVPGQWVGTGKTIYDNKGSPVKKYEPYFATSERFDTEPALVMRGVTPVMRYDPLSRLVRVDQPDGTFRETAFDPWTSTSRDEIDTLVAGVPWYDERIALPAGDVRRIAAERAVLLAGTPMREHRDPLGRTIVTAQDNQQASLLETSQELDLEGNVLAVLDPRGVLVAEHQYDVAGRCVEVASVDAGPTTTLHDAAGKPLIVWRGTGADLVRIRHEYDRAERATHVYATDRFSPVEALRERVVYRDWDQGAPPPNSAGRIAVELDGAGSVSFTYDFAGHTEIVARRVARDYDRIPAWDAAVTWTGATPLPPAIDARLETEVFTVTSRYDAMGRPIVEIAPDQSVTDRSYDVAGRLLSVAVTDPDGNRQSIVDRLEYDEKSRRHIVNWGHQVETTYGYDPKTFRLANLAAVGPHGERYQDFSYSYDAVGNITRIHDAADDAIYFANAVARPELDYAYDALYRLTLARGREHRGQSQFDQRDVPAALVNVPIANANDLSQIGEYMETFRYDDSGNLDSVTHVHGATSWTRDYDYTAGTNRLAQTHTGGVDASYPHDGRGNMTAMAHLFEMGWSHRDQLWRATRTKVGNGAAPVDPSPPDARRQPVYFAYDLRGQRVRKVSENGALRRERIYVGAFEVYRETRSATLEVERTTLHVSDQTGRLALFERRTPRSPDDGSEPRLWRFQHTNHLGSATLELSETRVPLSHEELHPFGTSALQSVRSGIAPSRYRFTGMERDDETGLQSHGVRYYASWLGRWTSADPAGIADGANCFAYVRGNPLRGRDPSGRDTLEDLLSGDSDTGIGPNQRIGTPGNWYEIPHSQPIRFVTFGQDEVVEGTMEHEVADAWIDKIQKPGFKVSDRALNAIAYAASPEKLQQMRGAAERKEPTAYRTFNRIDGQKLEGGVKAMMTLQSMIAQTVFGELILPMIFGNGIRSVRAGQHVAAAANLRGPWMARQLVIEGHALSQGKATLWARSFVSSTGEERIIAYWTGYDKAHRLTGQQMALLLEKQFAGRGPKVTVLSGVGRKGSQLHSERLGWGHQDIFLDGTRYRPSSFGITNRAACSHACEIAQLRTDTVVLSNSALEQGVMQFPK